MESKKRYLFITDEKGDPGLASGASDNLVFGGYVVDESELSNVIRVWRKFKADVCETSDVELKSEHFFASRSKHNPLSERNREKRRDIAMKGFELIYSNRSVAPLSYCVFKNRASDALKVESKNKNYKIDADTIWVAPFVLFGLFLTNKRATGQVWWDGVSGQKEEDKKNSAWQKLKCNPLARKEIQAIDGEILFLDSKESEAIQVADFLCGVLWQAMKGDEIFLARFLEKYDPRTRRDGLGIVLLE